MSLLYGSWLVTGNDLSVLNRNNFNEIDTRHKCALFVKMNEYRTPLADILMAVFQLFL